jgi:hypothetical protein
MRMALAAALGFIVSAGIVLAQNRGRNIPPPFDVSDLAGLAVSSASFTATGTANEFVCSTTTNACEFASSTNAATMTSTVPAVDIGPTATPDANDRLGCFSYGASGSKTRVACVDTEGDLSASGGFNSGVAASGNAFTCTNPGCRISFGATSRYIDESGGNQLNVVGYSNFGGPTFVSSTGQFGTSGGNTGVLAGNVADGASAVATRMRSVQTFSTAGAKITNWVNNATEVAYVDKDGLLRVNAANAAKPTCNATNRGKVFYLDGAAGVADTFEVCGKDASDVYAWKAIVAF